MPSALQRRQIALPWLTRLRWLAVIGQVAAVLSTVVFVRLRLPLLPIALIICCAVFSNLALEFVWRFDWLSRSIVPVVILLDICLFTLLLYFTGGTENPFSLIYCVHVAMAAVILGVGWGWGVLALVTLGYGLVHRWHHPITPLSPALVTFGNAVSLVLVSGLIAYFVERVTRELRRKDRQLSISREKARRTEHLAALTTLAAGAAHELGTPLSTIALIAKELERGDDPAALGDDARLIRQEVERCRQILDRMRVDVIEDAAQRTDVESFVNFWKFLRDDLKLGEANRLVIESGVSDAGLLPHPRVWRRAIGVLLRNAFDASDFNSSVRLLHSHAAGEMIFEVHDTGCGMPENILRRAGEPFFTTKTPGQGMGLGLFLVRLAAETYGGEFTLQSRPGAGTTSRLKLPISDAATKIDYDNNIDPAAENEHPDRRRRRRLPHPAGQSAVDARL